MRLNFGTIGSALLWAPFYGVGDIVARVGRLAGSSMPVDGFSPPYIAAVTYGSAVYGFLAVVLSILAVRLWTYFRWVRLKLVMRDLGSRECERNLVGN